MKKILIGYFVAVLLAGFMAGCGSSSSGNGVPDATAPTVTYTAPAHAASGVATNLKKITATFSEAMDASTISAATFAVTGLTGTVGYDAANHIAIFTTSSPTIASNATFNVTIKGGATGVKDLAGNALAIDKAWSFTTGSAADDTAPFVFITAPADTAVNVPVNRIITATFNEPMDPSTISTATFTVMHGATPVPGTVTYSGTTASFKPTSKLTASTLYSATITTGAQDLAGNALARNKVWSFTTGTVSAKGPAPVVLGTAGNFVILTKAGITSVPTSAITGNVGTSPITGAAIVLDCTEITGNVYTVDAAGPACRTEDPTTLTAAIGDMELAYTTAAGRTLPDETEKGAGDISGMTIAPGLYKWSSGVLIASDIYLSGGANDVWIFQIAQDLTVSSDVIVHLSGGAQAKNVFWQVAGGTGVTFNSGSHFEGIVMAVKAINLVTGASINGRLYAQTEVTLQMNTVAQP